MIPAPFEYRRARSIDDALGALQEFGDDAKLLAGGHSLLPLMKLRFATPAVLVDIGRLPDLSYIRVEADEVRIGALTRHREVERSADLQSLVPLLPAATAHVGDPQVRECGTIGGSIAHGDPASDLPAVLLALDARLVATSPAGSREIHVDDFFTGFLETALSPTELLTEIRVPLQPAASWSFKKFTRRAQDWAIVGAAVVASSDQTRVGLVNMDATPVRARETEQALGSGASIAEAADLADAGLHPPADLHATVDYRRHLARTLVRRSLDEAR